MPDPRRRQHGAATLEFALVVPIFLLLAAGTITLGHALIVRSELSSAAMVAARAGALTGRRDQASAQNLILRQLGADARACVPLQVIVGQIVLLDSQRSFQVTLDCPFGGGVGSSVMVALGIPPPRMVVSATMPF